jgi:hypothetical protein
MDEVPSLRHYVQRGEKYLKAREEKRRKAHAYEQKRVLESSDTNDT